MYILLIGVMSLSIVGGILAFQIFSAATKSQLTENQIIIVKPIDGVISQTSIDNLEKRTKITDDDINAVKIVPEETPTITPTPSLVEASPSAEVIPPLQ